MQINSEVVSLEKELERKNINVSQDNNVNIL